MKAATDQIVDLTADLSEEDRAIVRNFPRNLREFDPTTVSPELAIDEQWFRAQLEDLVSILKDEGIGALGGEVGGEIVELIALGYFRGMWYERERNGLMVSSDDWKEYSSEHQAKITRFDQVVAGLTPERKIALVGRLEQLLEGRGEVARTEAPDEKKLPHFEEVLAEVRRPIRMVLQSIRALSENGSGTAIRDLAEREGFCYDFWDTLEDLMRGFERLQDLHEETTSDRAVTMDRAGFRAAMFFYLGADVARAITDEEIRKILQDSIGTIYPQGREAEKERPLGTVLDAAVHLTRILDRRMRSPEAWGLLKKARNCLRWAVEKEETLRAKPSITERIRQAKEETAAAEISADQVDEEELAGAAAEAEAAAD